jgi:hypothetical protein
VPTPPPHRYIGEAERSLRAAAKATIDETSSAGLLRAKRATLEGITRRANERLLAERGR